MMIGLSPTGSSPIELSVLARWTIRPRLMGVPGVANVAIWGQRDRQLQVQVDPERLRGRACHRCRQVIETTGNAQLVSPLTFLDASTPGTGGFIDTPNQRLGVRHVLPSAQPDDLAQVPVDGTRAGERSPRRRRHRRRGPPAADRRRGRNDGHGLMLVVEKLPGANTLEVTRRVDDALDELRPGLTGVRWTPTVFRPGELHRAARSTTCARGCVDRRCAAGAGAAGAPAAAGGRRFVASVAIAALARRRGARARLTGRDDQRDRLAGLVVAIGVVVDDAVVDVRDIERPATDGCGPPRPGRSSPRADPLGFATLIVLLAAAPVLFLSGADRRVLPPWCSRTCSPCSRRCSSR